VISDGRFGRSPGTTRHSTEHARIVAVAEQQIESLAEAVDFLVDLSRVERCGTRNYRNTPVFLRQRAHAGARLGRNVLWMGSRDLRRIYAIDPEKGQWSKKEKRRAFRGRPVSTNGTLRFTIGEGPDDDRYIRTYDSASGFGEDRIACPEFTGSYLSFDGDHLYLSQWYNHRILKLMRAANILRIIEVGAEICGHAFVDGSIYVLRGKEQPKRGLAHARLDPRRTHQKSKISPLSRSRLAH